MQRLVFAAVTLF